MTVNAITDTKKGRTGIAPIYLHTTRSLTKRTFKGNSYHYVEHTKTYRNFTLPFEASSQATRY